jgi:hypothetical protein
MNAANFVRSRRQNRDAARRCAVRHDLADLDPITHRRHCRRRGCLYHTPGIPELWVRDADAMERQADVAEHADPWWLDTTGAEASW